MPEIQSSVLASGHAGTCPEGETSLQSEMTKIFVAGEETKLLSLERAVRLAKKAARKRWPRLTSDRRTVCSALRVYWPYWMGTVQTEKDRPIFGPRRITYYAIGDAVAGGHAVTRAMPDFVERLVPDCLLVSFDQGVDAFERELAIVQKEKIPKLFIFGPPRQQVEKVRLIYCPYWEINYFLKEEQARSEVVHVNGFNGSVRAC